VTVSIIIPTLNEVIRIAQSVERALRLSPHEVIVVDGGSQDGTVAAIQSFDCHVLQCGRGRGLQQNVGASHATGDVLLFLHADCWLEPDGLQQIETILAKPRVFGGAFRQQIEADGLLYRLIERGNAARVRVRKLPYGDQGIFLRRCVFNRLGGFPNVQIMEDLLLMRSVRMIGSVVLLPGPIHVSARRWQRHGVVRQTAQNWRLIAAQWAGVSPDRLAKFYRSPFEERE